MAKVYQNLISPIFSTTITVNGEVRELSFRSGAKIAPERVHGTLMVTDPELIKAMDSSIHYGNKWICVSEQKEYKPKPVDDIEVITEITTVKEMREYLNKVKGVPYSRLNNKYAAELAAKEHKLNFINVP